MCNALCCSIFHYFALLDSSSWCDILDLSGYFNTLRPRQNGRHFPDHIFKWIFVNENVWISINISLKFVPRGPVNNIPTLVQVMADQATSHYLNQWRSVYWRIYASIGLSELKTSVDQRKYIWTIDRCNNSEQLTLNIVALFHTVPADAKGLYSLSGRTRYRQISSRRREIGCHNNRIARKFDKDLGYRAADVPVKFQSDLKSLTPKLAVPRLSHILR